MQDEKPTRDIPRHEARRNARGVAWRTINQYVFALACGVREFYGGIWMKRPGEAVVCCNDGLRPVYFKLEATEDEAGPFLGREEQK